MTEVDSCAGVARKTTNSLEYVRGGVIFSFRHCPKGGRGVSETGERTISTEYTKCLETGETAKSLVMEKGVSRGAPNDLLDV